MQLCLIKEYNDFILSAACQSSQFSSCERGRESIRYNEHENAMRIRCLNMMNFVNRPRLANHDFDHDQLLSNSI